MRLEVFFLSEVFVKEVIDIIFVFVCFFEVVEYVYEFLVFGIYWNFKIR